MSQMLKAVETQPVQELNETVKKLTKFGFKSEKTDRSKQEYKSEQTFDANFWFLTNIKALCHGHSKH